MAVTSQYITLKHRLHANFIFIIGLACMVVAGYFLIQGLSEFAGTESTRNILIVGGILFQVTESMCFIAAASLTFHSYIWRVVLFSLGVLLFIFSIAVMTLAQKTALQTGINEAGAIDEKRTHLRAQLQSLDSMIESYKDNAEKQSRSIFKDSRALGQDSINRATDIEQQKMALSDQLFNLNQERRETSVDFFRRLETVTSLPAKATEFYFLVLRSLLIELCGILLMAFGANLRALTSPLLAARKKERDDAKFKEQGGQLKYEGDGSQEQRHRYSKYIEQLKGSQSEKDSQKQVASLAKEVMELHKYGYLKSLSRDNIVQALRTSLGVNIGSGKAMDIKAYIDAHM